MLVFNGKINDTEQNQMLTFRKSNSSLCKSMMHLLFITHKWNNRISWQFKNLLVLCISTETVSWKKKNPQKQHVRVQNGSWTFPILKKDLFSVLCITWYILYTWYINCRNRHRAAIIKHLSCETRTNLNHSLL